MGVEVNDGDRAVFLVHRAEERKSDGVVTTKGDDARKCLALLGGTKSLGVGVGSAGKDGVVAFLNLLEGVGVVVGRDGDVTAIDDPGPGVERVGLQWDVVSAAEAHLS